LQQLGQAARGRQLEEQALAVLARTVPDEHPVLQTARGNLGLSCRDDGDLDRARALHEKRLAVAERFLPPDHADLLIAREHFALTVQDQGDYALARAILADVLAARARTLPADDPRVLLSRMQLAGALGRAGDYAGARALLEQAFTIVEQTLPEDHDDRLAVVDNLTLTLQLQGELEQALVLQRQAFELRQRLPPNHPPSSSQASPLFPVITPFRSIRVLSARLAAPASDSRSVPVHHGEVVPARQAYSHWAAVGNTRLQRPSISAQSFQLTCSTGWRSGRSAGISYISLGNQLGFTPAMRSHCAWVTSYFDMKKGSSSTCCIGCSVGRLDGS
jgi:tetratricopeptide (TPR) repeat protein